MPCPCVLFEHPGDGARAGRIHGIICGHSQEAPEVSSSLVGLSTRIPELAAVETAAESQTAPAWLRQGVHCTHGLPLTAERLVAHCLAHRLRLCM